MTKTGPRTHYAFLRNSPGSSAKHGLLLFVLLRLHLQGRPAAAEALMPKRERLHVLRAIVVAAWPAAVMASDLKTQSSPPPLSRVLTTPYLGI